MKKLCFSKKVLAHRADEQESSNKQWLILYLCTETPDNFSSIGAVSDKLLPQKLRQGKTFEVLLKASGHFFEVSENFHALDEQQRNSVILPSHEFSHCFVESKLGHFVLGHLALRC